MKKSLFHNIAAVAIAAMMLFGYISMPQSALASDEPVVYAYQPTTGGIAPSANYGLNYSTFDSIAIETIATANRAEANYGWGTFAANSFQYPQTISENVNALVIEMAFPQANFAYGLQMVAIDNNGNKVNMHAGYSWNNTMDANTKKSFFRMHDVTNAAGEAGKIYEIPRRAWIFAGLTVKEDAKVVSAQNVKAAFYGKWIFPLENYADVDFKNLKELIFMSAFANNKYGRFNVGSIYLADLDYTTEVTARPYVIDNTDGSKLTEMTKIWAPSEANAVPYLPAALNGVDDGAVRVSYCPAGMNIERDKDALTGNYTQINLPFAADLGTKVQTTDLGFYFTVDNTNGPELEYALQLTDSEDTTNVWKTATDVNAEAYKGDAKASIGYIENSVQNLYPAEGAAYTSQVGKIPANFKGKIFVAFTESNFVATKEESTFPATVESTMKVLVNMCALEVGQKVNIKVDAANTGWQSASEVTPIEPDKDITDYDVSAYSLNQTNAFDEQSLWVHFSEIAKGDNFWGYDFTKEGRIGAISTAETLGLAVQVQNPKTANRPFNLQFIDADGEIFVPNNKGAGVQLVYPDGSVKAAEIRNTEQIRIPGLTTCTAVIPWSSLGFLQNTDGSKTPVNGKPNTIVKVTMDVYPDQPAPSELEWIVGDMATISKETGALNTPIEVKYSDWELISEVKEGLTLLDPLPSLTISYEVNIPEGMLDISLSAEKVYYPFGAAYLLAIADEGYEIVSVTLNGKEAQKSGANKYDVTGVEGDTAHFVVTLKAIEEEPINPGTSSNGGATSSETEGCFGSIGIGGGMMFALAAAVAVILKKRK
ncbi:MAG: hypothetical protein IJW13_02410 [Clostridia bacterium]|nr:hypothetical protein [Clostridia bacterium]